MPASIVQSMPCICVPCFISETLALSTDAAMVKHMIEKSRGCAGSAIYKPRLEGLGMLFATFKEEAKHLRRIMGHHYTYISPWDRGDFFEIGGYLI